MSRGGSASDRTRGLVLAGALFNGLLAGGNLDRLLVAMPAWHEVGTDAWAAFSQHADLGNGLILYPMEAGLGAACVLAAAVSYFNEPQRPRSLAWPLGSAAILAAAGLLLTFKAAPLMLRLQQSLADAVIADLFARFDYWGNLRAICQIAAFFAGLWGLALRPAGNHE